MDGERELRAHCSSQYILCDRIWEVKLVTPLRFPCVSIQINFKHPYLGPRVSEKIKVYFGALIKVNMYN